MTERRVTVNLSTTILDTAPYIQQFYVIEERHQYYETLTSSEKLDHHPPEKQSLIIPLLPINVRLVQTLSH